MVTSRGSQIPPCFIWIVWHGAAPAGRLWELCTSRLSWVLPWVGMLGQGCHHSWLGHLSVQIRPLHPQYCSVCMDLLTRVQLDEQTASGVGLLIADDLSQKATTPRPSSQSEISELPVCNLYFIKPCKYMCTSRALSSKSGVLQGFSRFPVVAVGSCHGYHGSH